MLPVVEDMYHLEVISLVVSVFLLDFCDALLASLIVFRDIHPDVFRGEHANKLEHVFHHYVLERPVWVVTLLLISYPVPQQVCIHQRFGEIWIQREAADLPPLLGQLAISIKCSQKIELLQALLQLRLVWPIHEFEIENIINAQIHHGSSAAHKTSMPILGDFYRGRVHHVPHHAA